MLYRTDWEKSRKRFEAFWRRELVDRCCFAVKARRKDATPFPAYQEPNTYDELVHAWVNPERNLERMVAGFERTYYGGEAYPATTMCLGASVMAAFFGAKVEFRPETVWFHPVIDDIDKVDWTVTLETSPLYKETIEATKHYVRECNGRYFVGLPELGSAMDDLSLLRGMQDLMYDMIDKPEAVKRGIKAMTQAWSTVHRTLYEIARPCTDGGCCLPWMQTWAPGSNYQMSCDFSSILSPDMFREFFIPELLDYLAVNEYGVYHWDGPDALKHLDALLEVPHLKAIQYTPGDGQPRTSSERWLPYFKRIQAAGKCLVLPCTVYDEVEMLMTNLSSKGLVISTWAPSEDEARRLIELVARMTHD